MRGSTRLLLAIWAVTTVVVVGAALLVYRHVTRVPLLAGRTNPAAIYSNPTALFEDPGLLGSAIEVQVTEEVRRCMAAFGLSYRGPAVAGDLDSILGSGAGYGIAAGPVPPGTRLGHGGPQVSNRDDYERALYGAVLDGGGAGSGCAEAGLRQLDESLATLAAMPYSLDRLQADAMSHPAAVEAMRRWSGCMELKGYSVESPLDLIVSQEERVRGASGDEARRLADEERIIAADDRDCRRTTIDEAVAAVAADLGPVFVESNRPILEALIPTAGDVPDGGGVDSSLGTGDVQVTLRWESDADLDLQVIDPEDSKIDYSERTSSSGGELDRDANYPCGGASLAPVENVYWPTGAAPSGAYVVQIVYRTSCGDLGPQVFDLVVRVGGRVVLSERQTIESASLLEFGFEFSS